MIKLKFIDLFCGAGGTTSGVERANVNGEKCAEVVACVNHDAFAISSHKANHPNAVHFTEDIRTLELKPLVNMVHRLRNESEDNVICLWASLECTNFSKAKGGLPRDADSRTLAEHLIERPNATGGFDPAYIPLLNPDIIYTDNEYEVMKTLKAKWAKHLELNKQMIELVRKNGLNSEIIKAQMERQLFKNGRKLIYDEVTLYNNDSAIIFDDKAEVPDNSADMILTSIPFGDHYEYSDNYNDFGHNHGNENFFKQMDFLTPNLLRILKPGRVAAIHVKDRIRYSYQNGTSFTTIADFSGDTVKHFQKHGFYLMGKITVTTDVVAENNQTYRLGWTEQTKDATKMGVGLPEYVLLFRKAPSEMNNAYADQPVSKDKSEYKKALWQLDAHAYQRSSGDRFLTREELQRIDVKRIVSEWKKINTTEIYDFKEHLRICEDLDEQEKLSSTFMTLPVHSNSEHVWTDVNRMNTLNAKQVNAKKEKHICPLQFDIIERLINRYTMKDEVVLDPFGGLFSTPYISLKLGRKAIACELNSEYFNDGVYYVKAMIHKLNVPTLFQLLEPEIERKTA